MKQQHLTAFVILTGLIISLAISLAGCARTASTRFYTLNALPSAETASPGFQSLENTAIGIGPVKLPDYLDRPQIVIRTSPHELRMGEFDKWAGSLKNAVPRVIADNLSSLTGSDQVFIFPWKNDLPIRYQVMIDINRFDAEMGSHADIEAQWTVFENDGRTPIVTRKSTVRQPATAGGYTAVVQAQSQALVELSRKIAATLVDIKRP